TRSHRVPHGRTSSNFTTHWGRSSTHCYRQSCCRFQTCLHKSAGARRPTRPFCWNFHPSPIGFTWCNQALTCWIGRPQMLEYPVTARPFNGRTRTLRIHCVFIVPLSCRRVSEVLRAFV